MSVVSTADVSVRAARQATVVVAVGVACALHIGKLPVAIPPLQAALGLSLVQAGFLLSLVQLAGMSLGLSPWQGFRRISLPMARPALAAGVALALMETLNSWTEEMLRLEPSTLLKVMKLGAKVQSMIRGNPGEKS